MGAFAPISQKRPLPYKKNIEIQILHPDIDQNHLVSKITSSGGTTPPSATGLHRDGGFHCRFYVLLNQCQCWLKVKNAMHYNFVITVNFLGHSGYHTVYEYVKKEDSSFIASPGHPVDIPALKTANATRRLQKAANATKNCKKS